MPVLGNILRRIGKLKRKIEHLDLRTKLIVEYLQLPSESQVTLLFLEYDLTKQQVEEIFKLMDEARTSIHKGKLMGCIQFEQRVMKIVPSQDYHFAESMVRTFDQSQQYEEVYKRMKEDGMNT